MFERDASRKPSCSSLEMILLWGQSGCFISTGIGMVVTQVDRTEAAL